MVLAGVGDSDRSLDYLFDAYLRAQSESSMQVTAFNALAQRGEASVRRIMERVAHDGVADWPAYRPLVDDMATEDVWRGCAPFRTHVDKAVRRLVGQVLAQRRTRDPWIVYALEGR